MASDMPRTILLLALYLATITSPVSAIDISGSSVNPVLGNQESQHESRVVGRQLVGKKLYAGMKSGIPYFAGLRVEYVLEKGDDLMPVYIATWEAGLTIGFGTSLGLERRLGRTPVYIGCGYNFTHVMWGVSMGDVALGQNGNIPALLLTAGFRTSYTKGNIFNLALGCLIVPESLSFQYTIPVLHIALIGA
jgi:hypothetical protein